MGRREDAQNKALAAIMGGNPSDYASGRGKDIMSDQLEESTGETPEAELEEREVAADDEILEDHGYGDPQLEDDDEGEEEAELEEAQGEDVEEGEPEGGDEEDETTEEVTASEDEGVLSFEQRTELVAALARDGLPERHIKAMTTAELLEYGAKRRKNQEDVDSIKEDMLRYKAQVSGEGKDKGDAEEARQGVPDKPSADLDLSELAESFGEEEASLIAKFVKDQIAAGVEAQTAPFAGMLAEMVQADQRSRLAGVVPADIEDGWFDKVEARAIELGRGGSYPELKGKNRTAALFDAALRVEYPDTPSVPEVVKQEKRRRQRKNGVPHPTTRRQPPKKLTGDELINARALMAASGATVEEIQEKLGT